jgi:hypothetical protein
LIGDVFVAVDREGHTTHLELLHCNVAPGTGEFELPLPAGVDAAAGGELRACVMLAGQSPFAIWQGEGLDSSSRRVIGDPAADGGYRLTGPNPGYDLVRFRLPAGLAAPFVLQLDWRASTLRFDEQGVIGRGGPTLRRMVEPAVVDLYVSDAVLHELATFPRCEFRFATLPAVAEVVVRLQPPGALVDLDRVVVRSAARFLELR